VDLETPLETPPESAIHGPDHAASSILELVKERNRYKIPVFSVSGMALETKFSLLMSSGNLGAQY
jgi:hypothetical protein